MAAVLAATLVVAAGVQGLVGLGLALVTAPVVTLLAPELMPEFMLWLGLTMPFVTLVREHHDIDWRGLGWSLPTRIAGTLNAVSERFVTVAADLKRAKLDELGERHGDLMRRQERLG